MVVVYYEGMDIGIKEVDGKTDHSFTRVFEVFVSDEAGQSSHRVAVSRDYLRQLGYEEGDAEDVVRASFAFLLEREDKTAILPAFALSEIETYFPEYAQSIRK